MLNYFMNLFVLSSKVVFYEKDMIQIVIMLILIVFKFPITHFIHENDKAKLKTI